jgi:predicted amidohydrolase
VSTLRITLVQPYLVWHEPAANRSALEVMLAGHAGATDLVVLPEMFTTGFTMAPREVAEPADGVTTVWMRELAAGLDAAVTGSVATRVDGQYLNRLLWVEPGGRVLHYDKRHLFRMAREHEHYSAGRRRLIVEWRDFRICPLVCYDLRFPVWSRNRRIAPYDLLLYVANWPEPRRNAWKALLQARALENLCYCAGVNRVGQDGHGVAYPGESLALDFRGVVVADLGAERAATTVTLDRAPLDAFREKFPAHLDADDFELLD